MAGSRESASAGGRGGAFLVGGLAAGSLILPTLWTYGLSSGDGGIGQNLQVQWRNPWILLKTVARILSFASLEVGNFLGAGADRVVFVERHWLLVPFLVVVTLVGLRAAVWMAVTWFRRRSRRARVAGNPLASGQHDRARVFELLLRGAEDRGARLLPDGTGGLHLCRVLLDVP